MVFEYSTPQYLKSHLRVGTAIHAHLWDIVAWPPIPHPIQSHRTEPVLRYVIDELAIAANPPQEVAHSHHRRVRLKAVDLHSRVASLQMGT